MKHGARILVVDDNEDFRMLLREVLEPIGYLVVEAGDGQAALEVMKKTHVHMAIVDVDMPRMNGIELSRQLKQKNPKFPIIMVTAYSQFHTPADILATGIDAFLQKPIDLERLQKVIQQL